MPTTPREVRILYGPFRGARLHLTPADSLRKILGLYEHELNGWLDRALRRVSNVVDVGANDGYFTFGSAAALERLRISGCVISIELDGHCYGQLLESKNSWEARSRRRVRIVVEQKMVGGSNTSRRVTLQSLMAKNKVLSGATLIKIDVEGNELEVLDGALELIGGNNLFLIEVHRSCDLREIIERFRIRGAELLHIAQRPLPFIGRETRSIENSWLVSQIEAAR